MPSITCLGGVTACQAHPSVQAASAQASDTRGLGLRDDGRYNSPHFTARELDLALSKHKWQIDYRNSHVFRRFTLWPNECSLVASEAHIGRQVATTRPLALPSWAIIRMISPEACSQNTLLTPCK